MTISASYSEKIGERLPSDKERDAANSLRKILAAHAQSQEESVLKVVDPSGTPTEIFITPALSELLMELLRHVGKGDAVTLVPVHQKLTTQQAADILNVSRPYLIGLLEKGEIPFDLVGRHRRILANKLFEYKSSRDRERAKALEELAQIDSELI